MAGCRRSTQKKTDNVDKLIIIHTYNLSSLLHPFDFISKLVGNLFWGEAGFSETTGRLHSFSPLSPRKINT